MNIRKFLDSLNSDVISLSKKIKNDISELDSQEQNSEKSKSQKYLTESILKLTSILVQIKKIEKMIENDDDSDETDINIIDEYISKLIEEKNMKGE